MLADAASVAEGKLYVHGGGWDVIHVRQFPTIHPSMALAILFEVDYLEAPGELPVKIQFRTADGEQLAEVDLDVAVGHAPGSIRGEPTYVPWTFTFPGTRFDAAGSYSFVVSSNDEPLAKVPLHVVQHGRSTPPVETA